jgi:hypothetical protein
VGFAIGLAVGLPTAATTRASTPTFAELIGQKLMVAMSGTTPSLRPISSPA